MNEKEITAIQSKLIKDPSDESYFQLASHFSKEAETRAEARTICLKALNKDPKNAKARLLLARLYYLDNLGEFCVRELLELKKYTNSLSLDDLIKSFGEYAHYFSSMDSADSISDSTESVLAEIDIDTDFDEIEDEL